MYVKVREYRGQPQWIKVKEVKEVPEVRGNYEYIVDIDGREYCFYENGIIDKMCDLEYKIRELFGE